MVDKILVLGGILLGSVLIVENFVISMGAYLFFTYGNTGLVILVGILIGFIIGYGAKGLLSNINKNDDEYYDF